MQWDGENAMLSEYYEQLEIKSHYVFNLYIRNLNWCPMISIPRASTCVILGNYSANKNDFQRPEWKEEDSNGAS